MRAKENTLGKAAKTSFDPKDFLANVGPGKTNLKFRNGQSIFAQGDTADSVFYIQKGKVKLIVVSKEGKEAVVAITRCGTVLWRRLPQRTEAAHRDDKGYGSLRDHSHHEEGHGVGSQT